MLYFGGTPKSLQMVTATMKLRHLLLGRKAMRNLDSILKSRDITLPTKVHAVKAMVFLAVMYGCETWTIKKPESESCSVVSNSLWPHGLYPMGYSQGWNTGVGSLSPLQGIFPTQGLNPGIPHCRQILYHLSHKRRPRVLKWVVCPFSRGSSWPRDQIRVSCILGRYFTSWTIREGLKKAEHWRDDAFELWFWRWLLRVPWTARKSNQSILKEINPE